MAEKGFGVKELNIAAAATGNPAIESVSPNFDIKAVKVGFSTDVSIGQNTVVTGIITATTVNDSDLVGAGSSFQGLYISNGMMITDNALNGNHYIGTAFNGLMAGPVTINGVLTIDGNYVVV